MIPLIGLSLLGGLVFLALSAGLGYVVKVYVGPQLDLFEAIVIAIGYYGPAAFGVGVAATFYGAQWVRTRELAWLTPTLASLAAEAVIFFILLVDLGRAK